MNKELIEKILTGISPVELLKIIFTPENVQAASYGATKAFIESRTKENK